MEFQKVIVNGIECILCKDPKVTIRSTKYKYQYSIASTTYHKGVPAVIVKFNTPEVISKWYGNIFSVEPLLIQDKNTPIKKWEVDLCGKIF